MARSAVAQEAHRQAFAALKAQLTGTAPAPRVPIEALLPTDIPVLDRLVAGGFPRAALVTLEGHAGRWSIAARLAAQVTHRGMAAIVDDGGLYPPSLARAGVRLERVLVVPAREPLAVGRAADILVRSCICRLVLVPVVGLREAIWMRLAELARRNGVLVVAIAPEAGAAAAAAGLRLHCTRDRVVAVREGMWGRFSGYEMRAEVRKSKSAVPTTVARLHVTEIPAEFTRGIADAALC